MCDDVLLVSEDDIELAILLLLEIEKTVVEGAGAVGLAALLRERERFAGRQVGLVLCGGNIEPLVLAEIIQRGMVKSGRLVRLRFDVRDVPGSLADVAAALGRLGANIDEVQHQRAFTTLSVERAQIEVVVQTRGAAHVEQILESMRVAGLSRRAHRLIEAGLGLRRLLAARCRTSRSAVRAVFSVAKPSPGRLRRFTEAVGCADYPA